MDIAKSKRCHFTSVRLSIITRNQLNACFLIATKNIVYSELSSKQSSLRQYRVLSTERLQQSPTVNTVITVYTVSLYTVYFWS